jgi:hypothetical protein
MPHTEWTILRGPGRERLHVSCGRSVLIQSPDRERVEVYRRADDGIEMFQGYIDEIPMDRRAGLLRIYLRGFTRAQSDPRYRRGMFASGGR